MTLLNKGRLSVQRVDREAWDAINKISKEGDGGIVIKGMKKATTKKNPARAQGSEERGSDGEFENDEEESGKKVKGKRKAKAQQAEGTRKSKRSRK